MSIKNSVKKEVNKIIGRYYPYPRTQSSLEKFARAMNVDSKFDKHTQPFDIIMPTFNRQEDTARTIKTLYKNCNLKFNLIIVDNVSTDGTREYLNSLKSEHTNINVIFNTVNNGGGGARKLGLKQSENEFVAFLDNDLFIMPFYFENLLASIKSEDLAGVQSKVVFPNYLVQINRPNYIINDDWILFRDLDENKKYDDPSTLNQIECNWIPAGATMWRRSIFDKFSFDENFHTYFEDNEFAYRLNKAGYRFLNCPRAVSMHLSERFVPEEFKDKDYTRTRFGRDEQRLALKRFYEKHNLYLAYGNIDGFAKHLGFSSRNEYVDYLQKN